MMVIIVVSIKRLTWVDVTIMVDNSEKKILNSDSRYLLSDNG